MRSTGIGGDWYPYKKREAWTQREDRHVKNEAETAVMLPQAKENMGPQTRRGKKVSTPKVSEGAWP
jgi:hypothetical protein